MRRDLLRFALAAAVIVLCTAGAVAASVLLALDDLVGDGPTARGTPVDRPDGGEPQTLLLVGSDHRAGAAAQDARSDTLMLVRLDPERGAVSVLSIPRDLVVRIPGHGVDRVNAAYAEGGLPLATRTVRRLLSTGDRRFEIHHALDVDFEGFRDAIDRIGCVYVDVDRRYLHSNAGLPAALHYAEIDLQPGYDRLCGQDALDFARFRHADNDLVRAARQQALVRDVRDQLTSSDLLDDGPALARIVSRATTTDADLRTTSGALRTLKVAQAAAGGPIRQLPFPATLGATRVTVQRRALERVVRAFLEAPEPRAPAAREGGRRAAGSAGAGAALVDAGAASEAFVAPIVDRAGLPVAVPGLLTPAGRYDGAPRVYAIRDRDGRRHAAYRLVVAENPALGRYYGIQGTTWDDPPILDGVTEMRRIGGRTFELVADRGRLRVVAWRAGGAVHWVSNTLTRDLRDAQMLGIARSAARTTG